MTTTSAKTVKTVAPLSVPMLPADLDAGLRRLKLAAIRRTAPEVLITAKTQRWTQGPLLHRRRPRRNPLPRPSRQHRRQDHRIPTPGRPDHPRRAWLRPARRHRHPTAVPARLRRLRTPLPRDRFTLAVPRMGPIPTRADHRGQHPRQTPAPRHRRHHRRPVLPHERRPTPKGGPQNNLGITARGGDFYLATSGDFHLAIDRSQHERRRIPTCLTACRWPHTAPP